MLFWRSQVVFFCVSIYCTCMWKNYVVALYIPIAHVLRIVQSLRENTSTQSQQKIPRTRTYFGKTHLSRCVGWALLEHELRPGRAADLYLINGHYALTQN